MTTYAIAHTAADLTWNDLGDGAQSLALETPFFTGLAIVGTFDACIGGGFYADVNGAAHYLGTVSADILTGVVPFTTLADAKTFAAAKLVEIVGAL